MAGLTENQGQLVFGLDIGTRSIVGTVGYRRGDRFCVAAQCVREHETRAMLDGQIHDIGKVGETIGKVKQQLEADVGRSLSEVCIAAAGRVLRTVTTYVEQDFGGDREVTPEDIYSLATMGVEKAYEEFTAENDTGIRFYCVGYTAMRYYMNGYPIGNLEGHKAKTIAIDLIATFLPDDVVDGLYKSVEAAGLHVANLTLEPIAAIQVAIPEKYRMLNMALVDVGAGTSDISITKDGAIIAYGMIPVAGDSLTDILVQHCLVDFSTAEQIKRQAGEKESIEYLDIMGLPQTITAQEVLSLLEESVNGMTKQVADCIRELNGDKPVSAVFVVGGGGRIPGYTESLARELGIVKERVAIRGEEVMGAIEFDMENPRKDSLMVTPIGICFSYYEQSNNFIFVQFNDMRVKLYDNGRLSVADAALQAQFPNDSLFPQRGEALTFTVNGKPRIVRGQQGEAAVITVNGEPADISARIRGGDRIRVEASTAGEPAVMELSRLPEFNETLQVIVNGIKLGLPKSASVNGAPEDGDYSVRSGDDIRIGNNYTVAEIAEFMDVPLPYGMDIYVNETPARPDTKVYENFTVSWDIDEAMEQLSYRNAGRAGRGEESCGGREDETSGADGGPDGASGRSGQTADDASGRSGQTADGASGQSGQTADGASGQPDRSMDVSSGQPDRSMAVSSGYLSQSMGASAGRPGPAMNASAGQNRQAEPEAAVQADPEEFMGRLMPDGTRALTVMVNRAVVTLTGKKAYVFVDIFDFIDFDLQKPEGRNIVTTLNGRNAEYMASLKSGDVIEIYWKDKLV